jgi:prepilin-type N-terminal cleavage/methylation domain-containing protein
MKTNFMKTTSDKWQATQECNVWRATGDMKTPAPSRHASRVTRHAFTLIELLVVIAIMAIIAAFILPVTGAIKRQQYLKTARAEMDQIATALDNYKAKYGAYPPSNPNLSPLYNTLYYELSGVTHNTANKNYTTLDSVCTIPDGSSGPGYSTAFSAGGSSIGGIINCTKGGAEDGTIAKNFLPSLKQNRYGTSLTPVNSVPITNLVTSVRGPDANYRPVVTQDVNPFRYLYPGTNNPSSYDLWIDLQISGKTNRISNWSTKPQIL